MKRQRPRPTIRETRRTTRSTEQIDITPLYRTVKEEAALRRLSPSMIRKLAREGVTVGSEGGNPTTVRLPTFKIGESVRIPAAEADEFFERLRRLGSESRLGSDGGGGDR